MYTVKLRNYRAAYQGVQGCCQPVTGLWSSLTWGADIQDPGWGWICKLWVPAVLNMRLGYRAQRLLHTLVHSFSLLVHYELQYTRLIIQRIDFFLSGFLTSLPTLSETARLHTWLLASHTSFALFLFSGSQGRRQNNTYTSFVALSWELHGSMSCNLLQLQDISLINNEPQHLNCPVQVQFIFWPYNTSNSTTEKISRAGN